jgi:hypothetical protein
MDKKDKAGSSCSCTLDPQIQSCNCISDSPPASEIRTTDCTVTFANRLDHFLARWGWKRMSHTIEPGLYRFGNPTPDSLVFASANYTLSFDALRSALAGLDAWILVLDTKGINVWCAAGKGTFGTDELVRRIEYTGLPSIVRHRKIIVPQLGAPGISWPEVMRRSKFLVEYGPVRATDLPEYLKTHKATPAMRKVEFPLKDRLILTPVELVHTVLPMVLITALLWFLAGPVAALATVFVELAGIVLFPALIPYIPTQDFSTKGLIIGLIIAIPFAASFGTNPALPVWANAAGAVTALLIMPAVIAYFTLNFTGCTTFTSRTGVKKEIFRYVPVLALMAGTGVIVGIILGASRLVGMI